MQSAVVTMIADNEGDRKISTEKYMRVCRSVLLRMSLLRAVVTDLTCGSPSVHEARLVSNASCVQTIKVGPCQTRLALHSIDQEQHGTAQHSTAQHSTAQTRLD